MKIAPFCFMADWAIRAVLKFLAILQKYPTFVGYLYVFIDKTNARLEFQQIVGPKLEIC